MSGKQKTRREIEGYWFKHFFYIAFRIWYEAGGGAAGRLALMQRFPRLDAKRVQNWVSQRGWVALMEIEQKREVEKLRSRMSGAINKTREAQVLALEKLMIDFHKGVVNGDIKLDSVQEFFQASEGFQAIIDSAFAGAAELPEDAVGRIEEKNGFGMSLDGAVDANFKEVK